VLTPAVILVAGLAAPTALVVATPRGESRVPIVEDSIAGPVIAAPPLVAALSGSLTQREGWVEITLAQQAFRFLPGLPGYVIANRVEPLASAPFLARDTLFLPLQFVTEVLPQAFAARYRYDTQNARLVELGAQPAPVAIRPPGGLRPGHQVTIDPGHGGLDPGNPGLFFPHGTTESVVTLQIGLLLREELQRRGVAVRMTRTIDTLIDLGDRGAFCTESCDLFVSLHINSLKKRSGYTTVRGFETYFLAEAKTEDAARVQEMENEAIRYEGPHAAGGNDTGLSFILKDLQANEYLRESARAAELIQDHLQPIHPGIDLGVKQAGFMVLTTARRPAVLAELGYSTNPEDGRFLSNKRDQRRIAVALAEAIVAYLKEYERKTATPPDSGPSP
jgi:N-acetylmuramoyl-L-alanine amidase